MTERDERALRDALQELGSDEPVDLGRVRRRAAERRRNARTVAGLAVVLVLVAGVVGLPRLLGPGADRPSGTAGGAQAAPETRAAADASDAAEPEAVPPGREPVPSTDPAPPGWRTEYYRDISFQVPSSWGYAVPPQSDWCADDPPGKPRADQRRPYVWLGADIPGRAIGCPARPASLLTEHVEALPLDAAVDYAEGAVQQGRWWVVTRVPGSAILVVTTPDRDRAERILRSARVASEGAPCPAQSSVAGPLGTRPDGGAELGQLGPVDAVVLCQYEPVADPVDPNVPRLRAAVPLERATGQDVVDALAAAPVNDETCQPAPVESRPDLAVLVQIWAGGQTVGVFVNPAGCPDGSGMSGGIDDGTAVRVLTQRACSALLTPPVALWSASGAVAENCLG